MNREIIVLIMMIWANVQGSKEAKYSPENNNQQERVSCQTLIKNSKEASELWVSQFGQCWKTETFQFWHSPYKDAYCNMVTHFDIENADQLEKSLQDLVGFAQKEKVPFSWLVPHDSEEKYLILGQALKKYNFKTERYAAMVCYLNQICENSCNPAIAIKELSTPEDVKNWVDILNDVFGEDDPEFTTSFQSLIEKNIMQQQAANKFRYYIGYLNNKPVATGGLLVGDEYGEISNIGTLESARKKGVATAMLAAIIKKAKAHKLKYLILTAVPEAQKLYQRIGFEEVVKVDDYIFEPKSDSRE